VSIRQNNSKQQKNERASKTNRQERHRRSYSNLHVRLRYLLRYLLYSAYLMSILKAQFQDSSGVYTMTWSYNPELWQARDIISHECYKSNSKLVNIISNEKLN